MTMTDTANRRPRKSVVKGIILGGITLLAVVFTNAGAAIITNRLQAAQGGTEPKYPGWGIGTTAAAVTDTTLVTESAPTAAGGRTAATSGRANGTTTNSKLTYSGGGATITAGGTLAITEAGLFDAVSAGNMLIRGVFSAVNVVNGDSIAFTFGLDFVPG